MKEYDVLVIGGGPAGSSCAIFLAQRGYHVALVDQARFPRDKVCGEFVSPAADSILHDLGVLSSIKSRSPVRLRGVAISSYGGQELIIDYPPAPYTGQIMASFSMPRTLLDSLLLDRASSMGVEVRQEHKVTDLLFDDGCVVGVRGRDSTGILFELRARMVVDAGGRNGVSLRRLGLKKKPGGSRKLALAAHWEGIGQIPDYCFMHVSSPGYTGTARVGEKTANVVLVVDSELVTGKDCSDFYVESVLSNPLRGKLLDGANLAEKVRTVDSLAFEVRPVPCGGLVLVGDATGFIDPFTGEGIFMSLRSSELAAEVIDGAFRVSDFSRKQLAGYDVARHREYHKKALLSKILQKMICRPGLCDRVVEALRKKQHLAQALVGVIGDFLPAERVVCFRYLFQILAAMGFGRRDVVLSRNSLLDEPVPAKQGE